MKNNETDYNVKIENPNLEDLVANVIFSIKSSDMFDSVITKTIDIRLKNHIDYSRIYEQKIIKKYIKNNGKTSVAEEENIPICKEIKNEEIDSILTFISYNKKALEIFKDYLFKINKSFLIVEDVLHEPSVSIKNEKKLDSSKFNFEEYTDKKEEYSKNKISGFYSTQFKNKDKYEKVIKIKMDNEWKTIYYCIYYKNNNSVVIDNEMFMQIKEEDIQEILKFIKRNKRNLEDFKLYIERKILDFKQTKQY